MSLADLGPYRLPAEDAAYEAALRDALVRELYDRSTAAMAALVPVLFILKAILDFAWDLAPGIKWVFAFIALVLAARLGFTYWTRQSPGRATSRQLSWAFLAGAALLALGFAAMNWLAWPYLSVGQIGLLIIMHAGINAAALSTMAPSVWSYLLYMGLDIISLLLLVALKGGIPDYNHLLILMLVIYLVALPAMSIQNHRALVDRVLTGLKLKELSLQDTLTGLKNRRFLMEFMGPESERILRSWAPESAAEQSLAIVMLDLDHFKQVNDTHGHAAGDAILQQLSQLLMGTLRRHDLVIRWGGEEFVLVARGADRGYALMLAERIREKVEAHTFSLPDGKPLMKTCSIGYSLFPFSTKQPHLLGWEQVLSLADVALYRAKATGRNRALGIFPGERPWEGDTAARLEEVQRDLETAARSELVRIMGELR
ncbi:MAG TPA: GGDEF domain-containing protein [Holophagaceae bacterium]|jgi:diguanylate cyclase (GGDEF)-like protein|nr:GGDEF domain-containing protein [Holophagaceae bacterium]